MNTHAKLIVLLILFTATALAQPHIDHLSSVTTSSNDRVLIYGSGFGNLNSQACVRFAGQKAPVTRWTDGLITAYVPVNVQLGITEVQVFTSAGAVSNRYFMKVTAPPPAVGEVRWRFKADADYIQSRPAVAPDGTVYAVDVVGHLYALDPAGNLKWVYNLSGTSFGEVSVGGDGTVYAGSTTAIFALNPAGTLKWQFNQDPAAFIILGPNVGPDGNIYAVGTQGLGVFSLTPQGILRWAVPENYDRPIVTLQEIVFSAAQSQLFFHANRHLRSLALDGSEKFTYAVALDTSQGDQQPAVSPDGTSVYSNLFSALGPGLMLGKFDPTGTLLWHIFDQFNDSTNVLSTPDVGPDGVIYDGRNLINLYAINSNGTVRWKYTDTGILRSPVVSPQNDLIFLGGSLDFGQNGFLAAISTAGTALWKIVLPFENGGYVSPMSRPRFSPDGQTAYIGTSIPGQAAPVYSYLYSVQTGLGGGDPVVSLSPTALDFGSQRTHWLNAPKTSTLTNTGGGSLFISTIAITGSNPDDFSESDNCPRTPNAVAPGAHCDIIVVFAPTGVGTRTANITITDNAVDSPQSISLTGIGVGRKGGK